MRFPVIIERNARTMVQERYTGEWLEQLGAGIVLNDFAQIAEAVETLLRPDVYAAFRERIARLNNRAVFEVTDIIRRMMAIGNPSSVLPLPNVTGNGSRYPRPLDKSMEARNHPGMANTCGGTRCCQTPNR